VTGSEARKSLCRAHCWPPAKRTSPPRCATRRGTLQRESAASARSLSTGTASDTAPHTLRRTGSVSTRNRRASTGRHTDGRLAPFEPWQPGVRSGPRMPETAGNQKTAGGVDSAFRWAGPGQRNQEKNSCGRGLRDPRQQLCGFRRRGKHFGSRRSRRLILPAPGAIRPGGYGSHACGHKRFPRQTSNGNDRGIDWRESEGKRGIRKTGSLPPVSDFWACVVQWLHFASL